MIRGLVAVFATAASPDVAYAIKVISPPNNSRQDATLGPFAWEAIDAAIPSDIQGYARDKAVREFAKELLDATPEKSDWLCGEVKCENETETGRGASEHARPVSCPGYGYGSFSQTPSRSLAIVVRGAMFRFGHKQTSSIGSPESIEPQREAWSALDTYLVKPFQNQNYQVDIFSASYLVNGSQNFGVSFQSMFGSLIRNASYSRGGGSQGQNAIDAVTMAIRYAKEHEVAYRFVVVTRHDVIFKQSMMPYVVASKNKVSVPFYFFTTPSCDRIFPTNDIVQAFDGKFMGCFLNALHQWPSELIALYMRVYGPVNATDFRVMVNIVSSSDSAHITNPLWRQAGRPEGRLNYTQCGSCPHEDSGKIQKGCEPKTAKPVKLCTRAVAEDECRP